MYNRKNSYDLLRILATIAVIVIHVSANYMIAITDNNWLGTLYTEHFLSTSLFNLCSRFAVPVFVMLSGALALDNNNNRDYKYYYKKIFLSVGVNTIIFSILYFLYGTALGLASNIYRGEFSLEFLGGGVKNLLTGKPFSHMWYMYMMVGIYLLVPFVIRIKDEIRGKMFDRFIIIFFLASTIGLYTSTHDVMWDPGYSYGFLGYFLMGYVIKKSVSEEKSWKSTVLIISGMLVLTIAAYFRYIQGINGISDNDLNYTLVEPSSPFVVLASLLIFAGFSKLSLEINFTKISKWCFEIYLIHAGIWNILSRFITPAMDSRVVIPIMSAVVFILSWLMSLIWRKFCKKIEARWNITERLFLKLKI